MPSPADAAVSSPDPVDEHRAASDVDLPRVTSVSVKLATFWPSNPKAWFAQSEAQFAVRGITQSLTKFYHCVAVLTEDVSAQLLDLISCPPSVEPFETLKTRLCDTFGLTPYQRFEAFLSLPFSSDMKPSHLMNKMLALLPTGESPGFLFRGHFLRRLPSDIRAHLLQHVDSSCRELALQADQLWQSNTVSGVFALNQNQDLEDICALKTQGGSRSFRGRSSTPASTSRRPQQQSSPVSSSLCWYHRKHGETAQRCRPPCTWQSGN